MAMSVEARLQALVETYRAQHGDAGLGNPVQLAMALAAQAPDLAAEIRALTAAVVADVRGKIAASADPAGEAVRLTAEIADREQLPAAAAAAGIAVARRLGGTPPAGETAGETVVAPVPAAVAPPPAAAQALPAAPLPPPAVSSAPMTMAGIQQFVVKNKWAAGIAALALIVFIYQNQGSGGGQRGGGQQGNQQGGVQQGGGQQGTSGAPPTLGTGSNLPSLPYTQQRRDRMDYGMVAFTLATPAGSFPASVLTTGSWQPIQFSILDPRGSGQIVNGSFPNMQLTQGQNGPARVGQVQWQQDNLNVGPMCLAFEGGQVQNETAFFRGSTICVYDASCRQSYGCGRIQ